MKLLKSLILICALFAFTSPLMAFGSAGQSAPSTGTVAETMQAAGYRYIRLEEQGIWIAANDFDVSVGDKIHYSGGTEMKDFHSNTLDRTFDSILFVQSASRAGPDAHAGMQAPASHGMEMKKTEPVKAPVPGEIKAMEDGETVASIYSRAEQLAGQVVSLNAKVIKINRNIMGKNWITLRDGTGTGSDQKLVVTSQQVVSPGEVVVASGKLTRDVDLGYGYTYKVLLEDTSFAAGIE